MYKYYLQWQRPFLAKTPKISYSTLQQEPVLLACQTNSETFRHL